MSYNFNGKKILVTGGSRGLPSRTRRTSWPFRESLLRHRPGCSGGVGEAGGLRLRSRTQSRQLGPSQPQPSGGRHHPSRHSRHRSHKDGPPAASSLPRPRQQRRTPHSRVQVGRRCGHHSRPLRQHHVCQLPRRFLRRSNCRQRSSPVLSEAVNPSRVSSKGMLDAGVKGSIVNVSSVAAKSAPLGKAAYSMSKVTIVMPL